MRLGACSGKAALLRFSSCPALDIGVLGGAGTRPLARWRPSAHRRPEVLTLLELEVAVGGRGARVGRGHLGGRRGDGDGAARPRRRIARPQRPHERHAGRAGGEEGPVRRQTRGDDRAPRLHLGPQEGGRNGTCGGGQPFCVWRDQAGELTKVVLSDRGDAEDAGVQEVEAQRGNDAEAAVVLAQQLRADLICECKTNLQGAEPENSEDRQLLQPRHGETTYHGQRQTEDGHVEEDAQPRVRDVPDVVRVRVLGTVGVGRRVVDFRQEDHTLRPPASATCIDTQCEEGVRIQRGMR